jgi:tetratricopeptide (TPR) repeat protein
MLEPAAREDVERHLADCSNCRAALAETMMFLMEEPFLIAPVIPSAARVARPARWRGVALALATAAALMLVVRLAPRWLAGRGDGSSPEVRELISAVSREPTRFVDGRLTGFAYGPPPGVTRGVAAREPSPDVRLAAARVEQAVDGSPRSRAAVGVAQLLTGDAQSAVTELEAAAALLPDSVSIQADLSAALLARASTTGPADLLKALAAADRALEHNHRLPEALFNRAVALDRLGDPRASDAWITAMSAEGNDRWKAEETSRLATARGAPGGR